MGAPFGGTDMITGKSVGQMTQDELTYEEWLLEGTILFGKGEIDQDTAWWSRRVVYTSAARVLIHIESQSGPIDGPPYTTLTEKAFDYLSYYGKVTDSKGETHE